MYEIRITTKIFLAALGLSLLAGCETYKSKETYKIVEEYNYVPFDPPRTGDGVGTIINIEGGQELVIASKNTCLPDSDIKAERFNAVIPEYNIKSSNSGDVGLVFDKFDVNGVFQDTRVSEVEVKLINPFEERIEALHVIDYFKKRKANPEDSCVSLFEEDGNLIIKRVLGAQGIEYKFLNNSGTVINVDADLLSNIAIGADLNVEKTINKSLKIKHEVYLGYRLWQPKLGPAVISEGIDLHDISVGDVIKQYKN